MQALPILDKEENKRKDGYADPALQIKKLEEECEHLRKDLKAVENMLEFERNRFQLQMKSKEAGLANLLSRKIGLEIQAIRETAEYVDDDNRRRLNRRLGRIDNILKSFGGNADAE